MLLRGFVVNVVFVLKTSDLIAFHMDLTLSKTQAGEGDVLDAVCAVSTNDTKRNYQVVWFKIGAYNTDEEVEIATNTFVNEEFKQTKRYEAELELDNPGDFTKVRFSLRITNLQSKDSGYIGCRIGMPSISMERFKFFTVQVPVQLLWWSSMERNVLLSIPIDYDANENVSFTEGEAIQLGCHCIGGYPRPEVEVILGSEDVTHRFTRSDELVTGDGAAGLKPIHYAIELIDKDFTVEYRFDGKSLKCVTRAAGTGDNRSAVINLRVTQYRPKFSCLRQLMVKLGQDNFNVTCRVKAQPEVKNATVFRLDRPRFYNDSLDLNETEDPVQFFTERINGNELLMLLRIGRVEAEHLGVYVFEATNEIGVEQQKVVLYKELLPELHSMYMSSSGSSGTKHSKASLITATLLFLLLLLLRPAHAAFVTDSVTKTA